MGTDIDDFFAQQEKLMALPEEGVDSYLSRRAKSDEPWVSLKHTSVSLLLFFQTIPAGQSPIATC